MCNITIYKYTDRNQKARRMKIQKTDEDQKCQSATIANTAVRARNSGIGRRH